MAFSADGSRLAVAQAPRSPSSGGTPPSPITVFDLATGQPVATMHADYSTERNCPFEVRKHDCHGRYGQRRNLGRCHRRGHPQAGNQQGELFGHLAPMTRWEWRETKKPQCGT